VHWNHAVKLLAAQTPNANLKADQPSANVQEDILVIPTPTVSEILVLPILVVPMQFVKTMEMPLFANVHQTMSVIHTFLAHLIPVLKVHVAPTLNVPSAVKDLFVGVLEDLLEVQTADLVVLLILVPLTTFAEQTPSAVTKADVQPVPVSQDTKEIPTQAVSEETVSPTLNAEITKPARTTNVLIPAEHLVDPEPIVKLTIMWLFVGVPEDSLEIHSRVVDDSPKMKFVKPAEQTPIAKLDKMTGLSADVKLIILAILYRDVDANVIQAVIVHKLKNVFSSNVWLFAGKELVVTTPTVLPGITVLIVLVLMISWETPEQDVTPNVQDTTNAQMPKLALNSNVKILAENLIQMYVAKVPIVK
jgi:hypothetical protein